MAPIKFEEHVKEKLDRREIQPSKGSWEKLNSRLDKAEKKSEKRWWIPAVAAVCVLLIASVFFVKQQEQNSLPVVETPVENEIRGNSGNSEFEQPVQLASENVEKNDKAENQDPKSPKNEGPVVSGKTTTTSTRESSANERLASNYESKRNPIQSVSSIKPFDSEMREKDFSEKMQELIAEVSRKDQNSGGEISEAEVDALLAEAAREISIEREANGSAGLDPDELLAQAEEELYQSFKIKIFNVIKDGYQKAVIAVSNKTGQPQEY
ncbi:MAG: hypothetical protein R3218_03810 [Christiangramia sp.]|nr:hypothetical protein [Christiangramia sp.]